jgi:sulfatase modifying factor 1
MRISSSKERLNYMKAVSINHALTAIFLIILIVPAQAQKDTTYIQIPAGNYSVGKKGHLLNPRRTVHLDAFSIAITETTNREFAAFIVSTGYQTDAERLHNAMVFEPPLKEFQWKKDSSANWHYPNGIQHGGIENKMDHPVTTISYADIMAYCNWARLRLPSLDEWEVASRAGSTTDFFWGTDTAGLNQYANIWHGRNHLSADSSDGYLYTAPVASFKPNALGLYDMYGNVFEFCTGQTFGEPKNKRIAHARGGSWWCSKNACNFFNSVDIGRAGIHASFSNQGFRTVKIK